MIKLPGEKDKHDGKKGHEIQREVLDELADNVGEGREKPLYQDPNRDAARGDRDRSGRHFDEEP